MLNKPADQFTNEERKQLMREAREAAELLVARMTRLMELEGSV